MGTPHWHTQNKDIEKRWRSCRSSEGGFSQGVWSQTRTRIDQHVESRGDLWRTMATPPFLAKGNPQNSIPAARQSFRADLKLRWQARRKTSPRYTRMSNIDPTSPSNRIANSRPTFVIWPVAGRPFSDLGVQRFEQRLLDRMFGLENPRRVSFTWTSRTLDSFHLPCFLNTNVRLSILLSAFGCSSPRCSREVLTWNGSFSSHQPCASPKYLDVQHWATWDNSLSFFFCHFIDLRMGLWWLVHEFYLNRVGFPCKVTQLLMPLLVDTCTDDDPSFPSARLPRSRLLSRRTKR